MPVHLSVHASVCLVWTHNLKQKTKIGIDLPQDKSEVQFLVEKVESHRT